MYDEKTAGPPELAIIDGACGRLSNEKSEAGEVAAVDIDRGWFCADSGRSELVLLLCATGRRANGLTAPERAACVIDLPAGIASESRLGARNITGAFTGALSGTRLLGSCCWGRFFAWKDDGATRFWSAWRFIAAARFFAARSAAARDCWGVARGA